MWREMARIIHEVQPRFAFVENSPMLTSRGLGTVLGDLAAMGFDAKWGVLGAADIGANHQRNRIWIVGHASSKRRSEGWNDHGQDDGSKPATDGQHASQMADADSAGLGTGGWEGLHSKRETGLIAAPSNPTMAQLECEGLEGQRSQPREQEVSEPWNASALADTTELFSNGSNIDRPRPKVPQLGNGDNAYGSSNNWWQAEPNVGRKTYGLG
jgi:DNA (cytosine-5)-methyltransferase 1